MRTAIIIVVMVFLAALGFALYWEFAGGGSLAGVVDGGGKRPVTTGPVISDADMRSGGGVAPGEHPWWDNYDDAGRRTSRLAAEYYERMKDGRYHVTGPRVEFFMKDGQVMRIDGKTGVINTQQGLSRTRSNVTTGGPNLNQSPQSGRLQDVILTVWPAAGASGAPATRPTMTITMNNASFDNETYRVQTEEYTENGRRVPPDEVKVEARGDDYEFDGRGLELQYNQIDRRLEYLRVAHGERLLIKHPGALNRRDAGPATRPVQQAMAWMDPHQWLAAADNSAIAQVAFADAQPKADQPRPRRPRPQGGQPAPAQPNAEPKPRQPKPKPPAQQKPTTKPVDEQPEETVYRATFKDDVVVTQGGKPMARADEMQVEFISQQGDLDAMEGQPTTRPSAEGTAAKPATTRPGRRGGGRAETRPAGSAGPQAGAPTTRRGERDAVAMGSTTKPTSRPSTRPAEEPVEVRWTGPLLIVPVGGDAPERIAPGESIVKLMAKKGKSVEVTREENGIVSLVHAGTLTHWTIDNGVLMTEGPGAPVIVTRTPVRDGKLDETRQTRIVTQRLHFSEDDRMAVLEGKSNARLLPFEEEQRPSTQPAVAEAKPPQFMNVAWTDRCTLYLEGGGLEEMAINRADLQGGVVVDQPQLYLTSDLLNLYFAPPPATRPSLAQGGPTTQPHRAAPELTQIDANGHVHCVMRELAPVPPVAGAMPPTVPVMAVVERQKIDCDSLKLRRAAGAGGKLYARNVVAVGDVHAVDAERDLRAGYVSMTLSAPTTRPATQPAQGAVAQGPATKPSKAKASADLAAGDLETMVAHDEVKVVTADGKTAEADRLDLEVVDGKMAVTLRGRPAVVTRGTQDRLVGPIIQMSPDTQQFAVVGAGRLDGVQEEAPGKPGKPVLVTWEKGLDGRGNLIEASGGVFARSIDADGTVNEAKGQRVVLTTAPKATTRPATQPVAAGAAATQPVAKKSSTRPADLDVMANREITGMSLEGAAETTSTLFDNAGKLLRLMHVTSEKIQFFQTEERLIPTPAPGAVAAAVPPADAPKAKRLVIPQAGKMIVVDDRPPSTQPAAKDAADDPMGLRGRTAFSWDKHLIYDEAKRQVEMLGNVEVARVDKPSTQPAAGKDAQAAEPMRVFGDRIIADIEPLPPTTRPATQPVAAAGTTGSAATQPTTRPARGGGMPDLTSRMEFKKVRIEGRVTVTGQKLNIEAESADYTPGDHHLRAEGTERKPVRQLDEDGLEVARFDWVIMDTRTGGVVDSKGMVITRRDRGKGTERKQP